MTIEVITKCFQIIIEPPLQEWQSFEKIDHGLQFHLLNVTEYALELESI